MALGSTQPQREMSTRAGVKTAEGLTTLPPSWEICEPQPRGTLWACNGTALPVTALTELSRHRSLEYEVRRRSASTVFGV
jgi:hypothetical protein